MRATLTFSHFDGLGQQLQRQTRMLSTGIGRGGGIERVERIESFNNIYFLGKLLTLSHAKFY